MSMESAVAYLSVGQLQREQNRLNLDLIKYSLDEEWHSSRLVSKLRGRITSFLEKGLYDPQDLEHQVLFRLSTYNPAEITDELIKETIEEQRYIIEHRLADVEDLSYLFRGFNPRSKDLNVSERLELKHEGERLYATGYGRTLEVEFRRITDEAIIRLFTEKLHYIHSGRHSGDTFGFFFAGDDLPWGVETTESSISAKKYKRDALLAHGIDPHKSIEITRLYLLPGSPKNAISILDGLVSKYYKSQGIEAMYTTTMPMYAKTKGATTSGGMKDVLLVKELSHTFRKTTLGGRSVFVHDVTAPKSGSDLLHTHPLFPTLLTVETFMRLNANHYIKPLSILRSKTIYIPGTKRRSEQQSEMRFMVKSLPNFLDIIRHAGAKHQNTTYMYDSFWGHDSLNKLRLRKIIDGDRVYYESSSKYRVSQEDHIRTVVNDLLYRGESEENAISAIKVADERYTQENSYEKVRMTYRLQDVQILVDIYPFGTFVKLIGDEKNVKPTAAQLGLSQEKSVRGHADSAYLEWCQRMYLPEQWEVIFGLGGAVHSGRS